VLTRLTAVLSLTVALLVLSVGTASAQAPECGRLGENGVCTVTITPTGTPPGARPVSNPGDGGAASSCVTDAGLAVPCTEPNLGTWSNALQCYLRRMAPQPPASDPGWAGRFPDGAVYYCIQAVGPGVFGAGTLVWLPAPPTETISPEEAARAVVRRMDLRAADIGIVPDDKPGSIGAVGAPVYMWTAPGPATFGPQVLTAAAGGVTITATAKVERIVWSMGDGTSVTCRTPGTVYQDRYGFNDSPDCGHRYTQTSADKPNNAYPIVATSFWVVDWTGPGGSSGQITLDLVSRTNIVVGELQALVTN